MAIRPRRSVLYMPGSNARAIEKARTLPVDAVILDLEDSVAPDGKAAARKQVADAVAAGGFGAREVVIRINGLDTEWWLDDLNAAAKAKPDAVLVPKVSSPSHLEDVAERLVDISADQKIRIWAMMETPLAMLNAGEIAAAARDVETRLTAFVMGTNDLAKDTRAKITPGRAPMVPWLMGCVTAARAHGVDILDGVYNDLGNAEGFARECAEARDMGFDGKTSDSSEPDRPVQRCLLAERRRGGSCAQDHRCFQPAREQRQGCRPARRAHGGTAACRYGTADRRDCAGDRGARPRGATGGLTSGVIVRLDPPDHGPRESHDG